MTPFIAEFLGTFVLIFLGDGVVANVVLNDTKGHGSGWIVITTAWAMAVYAGVVIAGPFSGAHLNPAVTIALAIAGKFPWSTVPSYIVAQCLGSMAGAGMVWLTHKDHFDRTPDPGAKLAVFCTAPAVRNPPINLLNEIAATFILLTAVFYITDAEVLPLKTVHIGLGSIGALPVALIVWGIGLSLGGTTGYAINPARDLPPRIMHALLPIRGKGGSDWGYAPIPVLGPLIGACLSALLFRYL